MNQNRDNQIDVGRLAAGFVRLPRPLQILLGVLAAGAVVVGGVMYLRQNGKTTAVSTQPVSPSVTQAAVPAPSTPPPPPGTTTVAGSSPDGTTPAPQIDTPNLTLGNPSQATTSIARRDNYLVVRPAYALSFNDDLGTANWVSWRIIRADFGQSPREVEFLADPMLPPPFKQIGHRDYTGSGFDRGHMCPKGDRGGDRDKVASTFYTSNIIPQAANVNQKAWNNLENYTRDLVGQKRQRVYVITGPAGRGGTGLNGYKETVGYGKVVVPAECWKVVVAIPDTGKPTDEPQSISASARVIAVIMPNDQTKVGDDWAKFRTTPAEIERKTKLRFFDRLKPDVAETLRQRQDKVVIPPVDANRFSRD
ncbi:DNA/RNA non-specific endonuclease [Humisphaera borealis]|uniref:Endonuclease n=1 Tax=Humisphaera borealis TaxID=2807512 RepID=A0A7M2WVD8_9BACT|nr:DNA/RNA non-specific endonuclease [Humisphaera borealis]QOV89192.1 DNA/RNA non-specific endonuclease [Humisphaera borealis]